jgi:hypothetical protein
MSLIEFVSFVIINKMTQFEDLLKFGLQNTLQVLSKMNEVVS